MGQGLPGFLRCYNESLNPYRVRLLGASVPLKLLINGHEIVINSDKDIDIPTADFKDNTYAYVGIPESNLTSDFMRKTMGEKGYTSTGSQNYTGVFGLTGQTWTVGTGGGSKEFAPDALSAFLVRNTDEIILGMTPRGHNIVYVRRGICRIGSSSSDVASKPAALVGVASYPSLGNANTLDRLNVSVIYVDTNGNLSFAPSNNKIAIGEFYSGSRSVVGYRCYDFHKRFSNENDFTLNAGWLNNQIWHLNESHVSVYGKRVKIGPQQITPDTSIKSQISFLYVNQSGTLIESIDTPHYFENRKGWYRRYTTQRCISQFYKNAAGGFDAQTPNTYQRYNPTALRPHSYSLNVASNGTLSSITDTSAGITVTKRRTGTYTIDYTLLRLRVLPSIVVTPKDTENQPKTHWAHVILFDSARGLHRKRIQITTARPIAPSF